MRFEKLFFISVFLISCASDNSKAHNANYFNEIGRSYTKKYVVAEHFDQAEFFGLKKILVDRHGLSDVNDFDEVFCMPKDGELLQNPLTLKYIKQKLVTSLFLDDYSCRENIEWYLQKIGISQEGINPFIEVVAADRKKFFENYLLVSSYEEIFSKYPNLHIYAAFRKSCDIIDKLYKDRKKEPALNNILESDPAYGLYVRERCGI